MASSHATCSDRGEGGEMFDMLDDCCYDSEVVEVGLGGRIVRRGFRLDGIRALPWVGAEGGVRGISAVLATF